jgi:hypothetical protein
MSALIILFFFGLAGGIVGKIKGSSFFLWFLISFFIPVGGLIAALLYRWDRNELRRECPTCGRICKLHDAICVRCGAELHFPDEAIVSEIEERELLRSGDAGREATA